MIVLFCIVWCGCTWTGHAAPSARAQMVWPSICLLISYSMSISSGRALPVTANKRQPIQRFKRFLYRRYPVSWTAQTTLHFLPSLADLFIPTPTRLLWEAFWPCSNYARRLFTHIFTTVYTQVLIYTAEWTGASGKERKCPNFETVAKGTRIRVLSIASPAFYLWVTALHPCMAYHEETWLIQ